MWAETGSIRVVFVHHVGGGVGGATISLLHLIKAFPPGTVQAVVLSPVGRAAEFFREQGLRVEEISPVASLMSVPGLELRGLRLLYLLWFLWEVRHAASISRKIKEFEPDLVHFNERGMLWAIRQAKRAGARVVTHARIPAAPEPRWLQDLNVRWLNRHADRVIAIDESVRRSLGALQSCRVVYNPLNPVNLIGDCTGVERSARGVLRVTFLAVLLASKGIWELVEAANLLRHRSDIRIQIAGGNARPSEFYRSPLGRVCGALGFARNVEAELRSVVREKGLEDKISLLGFVRDTGVLLKEQTDVLVFPSHLNGVGRPVFEAGAMGIPSVVCLRDRVQDIVVDGVTGLIVPERDPQALAKAFESLADDSMLCRQMGENARRKYREQFEPAAKAREVLAVYRELLRAPPSWP